MSESFGLAALQIRDIVTGPSRLSPLVWPLFKSVTSWGGLSTARLREEKKWLQPTRAEYRESALSLASSIPPAKKTGERSIRASSIQPANQSMVLALFTLRLKRVIIPSESLKLAAFPIRDYVASRIESK